MHVRALFSRNEGVTAIEFAVVAPVLLFILFTMIEIGLLAYASSLLDTLTNQAARFGRTGYNYSVTQNRADFITDYIKSRGAPLLVNGNFTVTALSSLNIQAAGLGGVVSPGYGNAGETIVYRVTYNWPVLTPMFRAMIGSNTYPITSTTLVKNEEF